MFIKGWFLVTSLVWDGGVWYTLAENCPGDKPCRDPSYKIDMHSETEPLYKEGFRIYIDDKFYCEEAKDLERDRYPRRVYFCSDRTGEE